MFSLNMLKERFLIVYGLDEKELEKLNLRFKNLCKKDALTVEETMGNCTLSNIIGNEIVEVEEKALPKEKVIIFNGFQGIFLQQAVKMVRDIFGNKPILASTTPNSVKMTLDELLNHLMAERQFYKKK